MLHSLIPLLLAITLTIVGSNPVCLAGWDITPRDGLDKGSWTMVSPSKVITCDGSVSEWRYQALAYLPFRTVVWRQVVGTSNFKIVGINDIPAGAVSTEVTYQVPASKRIAVKAGDMIGWSFGEGVLAYNAGGSALVRWVGWIQPASLVENQMHFINDGSENREYSIKATVLEKATDGEKATVGEKVCLAGWDIGNRGGPDSAGWTMVSPSKVITCSGAVSGWRYQAKGSHPFRAVVWRQVAGATTQFKIVGINDIPAGAINTEVTYQVPANERIAVKTGDMIGWSFGEGVLTYDSGGGTLVRWVGGNRHVFLVENQYHDINGGFEDREYSIMATVKDNGDTCVDQLGMKDGTIPDRQITASSEWDANHGPNNARLDRPAGSGRTGAWSASSNDVNQWIQVEFGTMKSVSGIVLQGRSDYEQWVTKYKVQYSNDGSTWQYIQDNNDVDRVFNGNTDKNGHVTSIFVSGISASYIRIRPTEWHGHNQHEI